MKQSAERRGFSTPRKRRKRAELGKREKRRLIQLMCCLILFGVVFAGRGVFPEQTAEAGKELVTAIRSSADFKTAFERLGQAIDRRDSLTDAMEEFCVTVFGAGNIPSETESSGFASVAQEELDFLKTSPDGLQMICRRLELPEGSIPRDTKPASDADGEGEPASTTTFAVGEVIETGSYDGKKLPEHTTMDHISLGELTTQTPVLGTITSPFGYRDHPVDGENKFHYGVDISAERGRSICAFADGVVEFVGESTSYGVYLQLDHANGVKSFYAHCDGLSVSKGERVTVGQEIGTVGDSGNATGTHLHFQLSLNGVNLDPLYYIETN